MQPTNEYKSVKIALTKKDFQGLISKSMLNQCGSNPVKLTVAFLKHCHLVIDNHIKVTSIAGKPAKPCKF
jgi:hypothetical protein